MVTPTRKLDSQVVKQMREAVVRLATELEIRGPFNTQFLVRDGGAYIIELNLRASRSMPFSSKARGVNLMELSADAVLRGKLPIGELGEYCELPARAWAVKTPQFSWAQLRGAYPTLGPEMKSTGEAASLDERFEHALLKSWLSSVPNRIPPKEKLVIVYTGVERDSKTLLEAAKLLESAEYSVMTLKEAQINGLEETDITEATKLVSQGRVGLVLTSGNTPWLDYRLRRLAADLNTPLVLEANLAYELSHAISMTSLEDIEAGELSEYLHAKTLKAREQ